MKRAGLLLAALASLALFAPAHAGVDGPANGQSFRGVEQPTYIGGKDSLNAVGRMMAVDANGHPIVVLFNTNAQSTWNNGGAPIIGPTALTAGSLTAGSDSVQIPIASG